MTLLEAHSDPSLEEEAEDLLLRVREIGSDTQLAQLWSRVYGLMEKKSFSSMVLMQTNMQAGRLTPRWLR